MVPRSLFSVKASHLAVVLLFLLLSAGTTTSDDDGVQPDVAAPACNGNDAHCWLSDSSTQSFMASAEQLGIRLEGVALASHRGLRGIVAQRDLPPRTVIMTVPRQAALEVSFRREQSSPLPASFVSPTFWDGSDKQVRLALVLLWEKQKGDTSPRAGLLASLPAAHDPPWRWDADSLALLQYSPLAHTALRQRAQWQQVFEDLQRTTPGTNISAEALHWALDTVMSRAFTSEEAGPGQTALFKCAGAAAALFALSAMLGENGKLVCYCIMAGIIMQGIVGMSGSFDGRQALCLAPAIDLINHHAQSQAVTSEAGYNHFRERFQVTTLRPVSTGSQLFNSYGPRSNDDLLLRYSFVAASNPDDVYVLDDLPQRLRLQQNVSHSRLALLADQLNFTEAAKQATVRGKAFDQHSWAVLRAAFAAPELLSGATAEAFQESLPGEQEGQVRAAARALLFAERDSKPTTSEQDEAMAASAGCIKANHDRCSTPSTAWRADAGAK
jgi:hypothetical protein